MVAIRVSDALHAHVTHHQQCKGTSMKTSMACKKSCTSLATLPAPLNLGGLATSSKRDLLRPGPPLTDAKMFPKSGQLFPRHIFSTIGHWLICI